MTAKHPGIFKGKTSPIATPANHQVDFDGLDAVEPEPVSLTFAERRQAISALFQNLKINEISLEDLLHEA